MAFNVEQLTTLMDASIMMLLNTQALKMEEYAKLNAPWQNRTGHARATLKANAYKESKSVYVIRISHGMRYGVYLELAHNKKYAIINPTVKKFQKPVMASFQRLIDNVQKGMI